MKIAFVGASGTGKTTLANLVSQIYSIPVCPVGSRSVAAAMGLSSPYEADLTGRRLEFQQRLLVEKIDWESRHESFVTDRTCLDHECYLELSGVADQMPRGWFKKSFEHDGTYDQVFYCPLKSFQRLDDDPARKQDDQYHLEYERLLQREVIDGRRFYRVLSLDSSEVPLRMRDVLIEISGLDDEDA